VSCKPTSVINDNPLNSQVGGDHYKGKEGYQPWEIARVWCSDEELKGAMKLKVLKYILRSKGGREDIEKAYHTIGLYLELTK